MKYELRAYLDKNLFYTKILNSRLDIDIDEYYSHNLGKVIYFSKKSYLVHKKQASFIDKDTMLFEIFFKRTYE